MHPRPRTGPGTVWQALPARGYLLSPWPWRALAYLATGAVAGAATLVGIVAAVAAGGVLAVILVGLPLLVLTALVGIPVARLERHRLRLIDRAAAPARPVRQ
ncbi:sensor domain-containing protein, partial [Streptomyces sp. ICN988]|uniref:sensor domain-containing protein n=1 Tax=Streptomyces sp. ICN988 TaxID=2983765 RepID=UPI0021E3A809